MSNTVVLLDLEKNMPSATVLREMIQHYAVIYVFNCTGKFEYTLEDMTEFASWVSSGHVVILETAEVEHKEFEYAVVVGQLMALLEPESVVDVISAIPSSKLLLEMMQSSNIVCQLVQVQSETSVKQKNKMPSLASIQQKPDLGLVKKYCDGLSKMKGKPQAINQLKNSLMNILQVDLQHAQNLVGVLINLKIVKHDGERIHFRKKLFKQWVQLELSEHIQTTALQSADLNLPLLKDLTSAKKMLPHKDLPSTTHLQDVQQDLYKHFSKIDPVQVLVARKLRELKSDKPTDIYALRDLLEQMFPKSDVRLLLKELIEKGYIYWNGSEISYSHEMFLN